MKWKHEQSFGGQLCQLNLHRKVLLKSDYPFCVTIDNDGFNVLSSFQGLFRVFRFPEVVQKHTLGGVGT